MERMESFFEQRNAAEMAGILLLVGALVFLLGLGVGEILRDLVAMLA
jgi:hypothetical protein